MNRLTGQSQPLKRQTLIFFDINHSLLEEKTYNISKNFIFQQRQPMKNNNQKIPKLKHNNLGKGVRSKYLKHFMHGSNVVVLQSEIQNTLPASEAVNEDSSHFKTYNYSSQLK